MKKLKIACILNFIIALLVLFGVLFMFLNITFMGDNNILSISGRELFKFFTVDSNMFMGVIAFIFGIYELKIIKNKEKEIPHLFYSLKLMATVSVTLTFLVTALFLVPTLKYPWYELYKNSNLFFHLLVPVLSIINFTVYERSDTLDIKDVLLSAVPVIFYSSFYTANVLSHVGEENVLTEYDFYGFLRGGLKTLPLVMLLIFTGTYAISLSLVYFHHKETKKRRKVV